MHVCLFDIDGTLLSSGGAGKAAIESALAEEFAVAIRAEVPYSGRTDRAIIRDLFHVHGIEETPGNRQRLLAGYLERLPRCLRAYQGRVLPGIVALLERLSGSAQFTVGLLTGNVRAGARAKLGHYGIDHHFAFGGFGDDHLDRNDVAREAMQAICAHCPNAVPAERIWVIGDTPLDVECARSIGARAVAVGTGWTSMEDLARAKPDLLLADLSDPAPLLASWS
jgi:phosphoglycolate phosphatase